MGSATLHFNTASIKWPGSALPTGGTTPEETGEEVAGAACGVATAVDGGPGGGGYSKTEAASGGSLAGFPKGMTDSAAGDREGDPFAAGVSTTVAADVSTASLGGSGGGGGGAAIALDLLGGGGGGGGGGGAAINLDLLAGGGGGGRGGAALI